MAFNGSIFLIVNIENKLPMSEIKISTIPNTISVKKLNITGTALGKKILVISVKPKPINVPMSDRIKVCANTTFSKYLLVKPCALSTPNKFVF